MTLALVLVVLTCTISIVTEPLVIKLVFHASDFHIKFDIVSMLKQLCLTILIPLVIGKSMTAFITCFRKLCNRIKTPLKLTSSLCLILVPWMKLSASHDKLLGINLKDIIFLLSSVVIVHLMYIYIIYILLLFIYFNSLFIVIFVSTWIIRTSYAERKSITILSSEKTLPVALTVLNVFPDTVGDKGLIMLPMIFGHFSQLIIDAFLCSIWLSYDKKYHPELFIEKGEETVGIDAIKSSSLPVTDKRENKKKSKSKKNKNENENDAEESVPLKTGGKIVVVEDEESVNKSNKKKKKGYTQLGDENNSDSD